MHKETNLMPSLGAGLAALRKKPATVILPQIWTEHGLPVPEVEYRFCATRKWKIDFAFVDVRLAIEIEGVTVAGGRHQRVKGYIKDIEKYNALTETGWRLLRYPPKKIDIMQIKRVYELCKK